VGWRLRGVRGVGGRGRRVGVVVGFVGVEVYGGVEFSGGYVSSAWSRRFEKVKLKLYNQPYKDSASHKGDIWWYEKVEIKYNKASITLEL
jgi:hypothetical protein